MKITFFYAMYESFAVSYLSAVLKKSNFSVELVFAEREKAAKTSLGKALFKSEEMYADEMLATNPNLIAFSSSTDTYQRDLNLACLIKQKDHTIPVVIGGIHPTLVPDDVIAEPCIDYICVGEGEEAVVDLAQALRDDKSTINIPNIWAKKDGNIYRNDVRPLIENLDDIPFYDKELFLKYPTLDFFGKAGYWVSAGRGCYNRCTYCHNSFSADLYKNVSKKYLRVRSVDNVIDELVLAKQKYKSRYILFYDEIFFYGKKWMDEFWDKYEKHIKLPVTCNLHVDFVTDELLAKIKKASGGFASVCLTIESIDPYVREHIFHRRETNESFAKALKIVREHGVAVYSTVIVNVPVQNEREKLIEAALFFNENKVTSIGVFPLRYYPIMEITKIAKEKGFLSTEDVEKIHKGIGYRADGFSQTKGKNNLIILLVVSSILPKNVLSFLLSKMASKKDNKLFMLCMVFYWVVVEVLKQLMGGKQSVKTARSIVFVNSRMLFDKCLYFLIKSPKNILAYFLKGRKL